MSTTVEMKIRGLEEICISTQLAIKSRSCHDGCSSPLQCSSNSSVGVGIVSVGMKGE